jgi:hypothetical protein
LVLIFVCCFLSLVRKGKKILHYIPLSVPSICSFCSFFFGWVSRLDLGFGREFVSNLHEFWASFWCWYLQKGKPLSSSVVEYALCAIARSLSGK